LDTVIVVGDGSVGTAAAVALSSFRKVVLAGPPSIETCVKRFFVSGFGEAEILYGGIDSVGV